VASRSRVPRDKIVFERAHAHEKIAFMTPYVVEEVHNVRISRWRSSGFAMWIFCIGTYDPVTFLGTPHASDPARVLTGLNRCVCGKFKHHFVTAAYVFVDMEKNSISYAGAGHPPLLLWRTATGTASETLENGLLLGLLPQATYSLVEIPLEAGDKVVLYTDGILETRSPSEQEFGVDLLRGFLESNHNLHADAFADLLLDELSNWSEHPKGIGQEDDITLLAINFLSQWGWCLTRGLGKAPKSNLIALLGLMPSSDSGVTAVGSINLEI
jgi:hypothetical protein